MIVIVTMSHWVVVMLHRESEQMRNGGSGDDLDQQASLSLS